MTEKRKVVVYKWVKAIDKPHMVKEVVGRGIFHQFGADFEEFEEGPGNYSTAIVEMPNGEVMNVPVELIMFNVPHN